jgi:hypothetical protein
MRDTGRRTEEISISGEKLVATVKELVHQGNIRRITIKNREGRSLMEIPLTLGFVGALLLPTLAALGALAALLTECTLVVERITEASGDAPNGPT